MYEFFYQVETKGNPIGDGGEFVGSNAQECADYIRNAYGNDTNIISILRVESEWK